MLFRDGAGTSIRFHHRHTEDALPETRLYELWCPVSHHRLCCRRYERLLRCPSPAFVPDAFSFAGQEGIFLVAEIRGWPIEGTDDPFGRCEEGRLREEDAPDLIRVAPVYIDAVADVPDPLPHRVVIGATVLGLKPVPCKPIRQTHEAGEERESTDGVVVPFFQFEEERGTDLSTEAPIGGGGPEIDLVNARLAR